MPVPHVDEDKYDSPEKREHSADVCDSFLTDLPGLMTSNATINMLDDIDDPFYQHKPKSSV
jgi:hypothetical protein